jgi:hypothetical protein
VLATSGFVDFFIQPDNSGVLYYVVGIGIIAPQQARAFISPAGTLVAADLVSPFQMWGKSALSPGNLNFRADLYPNGLFTNSVPNLAIDGATFDLSNPTFSPTIPPTPQSVVIVTTPIQQNINPGVDNVFNIGSAIARYAAGFFNTLNATVLNITNFFVSGFLSLVEIVAPAGVAGRSLIWDDSTAHRLKMNNNNAGAVQVVASGADINTADQVTIVHLAGVTNNKISKSNATGNQVDSSLTDTGALVTSSVPINMPSIQGPGLQKQIFTSNGTFTIPTGITQVKVKLVGAGGAGGSANNVALGTGGGSGGYAEKYLTGLTPANTIAVTIGAGGTPTAGANGGNGTSSIIASGTQSITTVTAFGGSGGLITGNDAGGAGAVISTNGDINVGGNPGAAASVANNDGGNGGPSTLGGAGLGGLPNAAGGAPTANSGSGGGGGGLGAGNALGAAGAAGIIIFEWIG